MTISVLRIFLMNMNISDYLSFNIIIMKKFFRRELYKTLILPI